MIEPRRHPVAQQEEQRQEFFLDVLRASVSDGIRSLLGQSTLDLLTENYRLDMLAVSPGQLHDELNLIFGKGALVIERMIVKELYSACRIRLEDSDRFNFSLEKCVERAKSRYGKRT